MITDTIENSARGRTDKNKAEVGQEGQACEESDVGKAPKPKADRSNKKGEVIALMQRAKGATWPRS